ncbi:DUF4142 domain-containing protein [Chryseobacterium flavum]|uniref:DUF4142 domain-containing protein n=1 Tax=Chryseobacterium flavum TaxID=415851 RepID=UPI0028ADDCBE|nr:DUF4142 domain-containing protein [Chryseobacterium flavum]
MKNYVVTLFAAVTLVACKKNETTTAYSSTDSAATDSMATMPASPDSGTAVSDSANAANTNGMKNTLSDQDKKFADAAARGGIMEVMMGELAGTHATNPAVKSLGEMMVKDHSKANDELKKWASTAGYNLPTGLDAEKQKKYDDLKAKNGAEFDRMYTDLMVSDHKKDIEEFKKAGAESKDSSLKAFANKTLPTLEHHLMESEKAKKAVR